LPRDQKKPNEPANLKIIAEFIAKLKNTSVNQLMKSQQKRQEAF